METRRILKTEAKPPDEDQRDKLFMTRVRIGDRLCDVIIDSGSCTNVVSSSFIQDTNHPTIDHPQPYKLHWLNNTSDVEVTKQALISFKLDLWEDQILCDVCPMDACHMLLGRPWQFDRFAKYNGRENKWKIRGDKKGEFLTLNPLKEAELKNKLTIENRKGALLTKEKELEKEVSTCDETFVVVAQEVKE